MFSLYYFIYVMALTLFHYNEKNLYIYWGISRIMCVFPQNDALHNFFHALLISHQPKKTCQYSKNRVLKRDPNGNRFKHLIWNDFFWEKGLMFDWIYGRNIFLFVILMSENIIIWLCAITLFADLLVEYRIHKLKLYLF